MTDSTDSTSETESTDSHTTNERCGVCGELVNNVVPITIDGTSYRICIGCRDHIRDEIENYFWYDWITEDHYDKAVAYLRSLDEVWCVKTDGYTGGELWVHTPYCDASVVMDVCDHFEFRIGWFGLTSPSDKNQFDCVESHGPCVEIRLTPQTSPRPLPLEAEVAKSYSDIEWMDDSSRLF